MNGGDVVQALAGGALIGASALALLAFHGRIAGVSGIVAGLLKPVRGDVAWRAFFVGGLLVGGAAMARLAPELFGQPPGRPLGVVAVAGVLVGFGTRLGNGCTSGHGVCGVSRLSPRSLVATATFMLAGMAVVAAFKAVVGGGA